MLGIALRDMQDERAVIGQEVRGYMDGLGVPYLTVFQAVLLLVDRCQKSQFRAYAEV